MRDQLGTQLDQGAQVVFIPPTFQPLPATITGVQSLVSDPNQSPTMEITIVLRLPIAPNGIVPAIFKVSPEGMLTVMVQNKPEGLVE